MSQFAFQPHKCCINGRVGQPRYLGLLLAKLLLALEPFHARRSQAK